MSKGSRRRRGRVAAAAAVAITILVLPGSALGQSDEGSSTDWRLAYDAEIDYEANQFASFNASPYFIFTAVYDKLLNYEIESGDPDFENSLATGYDVSKDGLVYTFHLRRGVKWADGEPFNADDVVWTYRTTHETDNNLSGYLELMKSVEKVDDFTVRLTLTKPDARIPSIAVWIMPEHIWSKGDPKKVKSFEPCCPMIGTGPFMIRSSLNKKGTTVLEPNPYFYGPKGQIKRILMTKYEDKEAQLRDIKLNRVDAILSGNAAWVRDATRDVNLEAFGSPSPGFTEIAFNMCPPGGKEACTGPGKNVAVEVIQDKSIRKALSWAIDRSVLVRTVYGGQATPGNGIISPFYKRYYASFAEDPEIGYRYDPDRAREILADGGWTCPTGGICTKNGVQAEFELLLRSTNQEEQNAGRRIRAWARDVGIAINLSIVTEDAMNAQIYNTSPKDENKYEPTFDAFIWGWSGDIFAPDFNFEVIQCGSGWTDSYYCNPAYDKPSKASRSELDPKKRLDLMHQAERIALEELPYIILVHDAVIYVHRTDTWKGYVRQPSPEGDPYGNSWLQLQLLEAGKAASTSYAGAPAVLIGLAVAVGAVFAFSSWRRRREDSGPLELPEAAP